MIIRSLAGSGRLRPASRSLLALIFLCPLCYPALARTPFTEEALGRGVHYTTSNAGFGYGVALADLDNDGDLDLVALGDENGLIGLFENEGLGHFVRKPVDGRFPRLLNASGVAAGDYDGDNDLDIYITQTQGANVLLRNEGKMGFVDVTAVAGVGDTGVGHGAAWADIDNDGWIDLFASNYTHHDTAPSRLYRNLGNGTFEEVLSTRSIVDHGMTFHATFFDCDRDGDADLYFSNDRCGAGQSNRLWANADGTFTDITTDAGCGACIFSMGLAVGDFDGNGHQDIYVSNLPYGNPLYLNQGDGTFLEFSDEAGVASYETGWGSVFFDFDNDTHQELFVAQATAPNRLYEHDGVWPCRDIAAELGLDEAGRFSHGVAVGDIDLDGDLDMLVSNRRDRIRLFINHTDGARRWVRFNVHGQGANRFAVGAFVDIRTSELWQTREIIAGSNYKSQNSLTLHYGLDTATTVDEVQATWPGGAKRVLRNLASNNTWTIYPDEALADGDLDGDVDLEDLGVFARCRAASHFAPGCESMDLDGDGDVDDDDHGSFIQRYSGPFFDCDGNGFMEPQDIVNVGPDGTVPAGCQTFDPALGHVPNGGDSPGQPLLLDKLAGGDLGLSWGQSCIGGISDYSIYSGSIGDFGSHMSITCSTDGATSRSVDSTPGSAYFLVVPTNGVREGSYGNSSFGVRDQGPAACRAQAVTACE